MRELLEARPTAGRKLVLWPHESIDVRLVGGKAAALAILASAGLAECDVPAWFVIPTGAALDSDEFTLALEQAIALLAPDGVLLAVRSSAIAEDGVERSYAGQLDSHLFVRHEDVESRIRDVCRSGSSSRVASYEEIRGRSGSQQGVAVIVQRMVNADAAGVAFSADPATGRRGIAVVAAVQGVGERLVQGDVNADEWRVDRQGTIIEQRTGGAAAVLEADIVTRVAALARSAARHFGSPQDIEWACENGQVFLLQSRPITSLRALPDPDGALAVWDNSNIVESYGGVTTPLTYSFARYAYEQVYRRFLLLLGVRPELVDANAGALRRMIGLVRGRVFYSMGSWYRALSLLPGYALNKGFMQQMMGVRESVPDELVEAPATNRARALIDVVRAAWGLLREHGRISATVAAFHKLVDSELATRGVALDEMRADELVAHYRQLESTLLARWDAPLLNDFFAMVHFGLLRSLAQQWCGDAEGSLPNDLVAGDGGMISTAPARRIAHMSRLAASRPELVDTLRRGGRREALAALATHEALREAYTEYLARFGDRCAEELKLETLTLTEDPLPLLRAIGQGASGDARDASQEHTAAIRRDAEDRVIRLLRGHPIRRAIFRAVLHRARARVRDRENLRFERTRVFGRVRWILVELGKRFAAAGLLHDPRDVFYLEIHEVLGVVEGTATSIALRQLATTRREEFDRYRAEAAPSERFETRGMVHEGNRFTDLAPNGAPSESGGDSRLGTGCYPGVVRGVVRVVRDPRQTELQSGEVLVAERTDPGWIMLFPRAAGLLVERGSLLSHSAIVSRELGIPSIVAIQGLTAWLRSGDVVELDGRSGSVRLLERAPVEPGGANDDQ